jgi:hypothetical protein
MSVMGKLDDFIANIVYDLVPSWRKEMMKTGSVSSCAP